MEDTCFMRDLFRKESDALWLAKPIGVEGWLLLFFTSHSISPLFVFLVFSLK